MRGELEDRRMMTRGMPRFVANFAASCARFPDDGLDDFLAQHLRARRARCHTRAARSLPKSPEDAGSPSRARIDEVYFCDGARRAAGNFGICMLTHATKMQRKAAIFGFALARRKSARRAAGGVRQDDVACLRRFS